MRRKPLRLSRRQVLAGLGGLALTPVAGRAAAQAYLDGTALGILPNSGEDQTAALAAALDEAKQQGRPLFLPAGEYVVSALTIPGSVTVIGVQGLTYLLAGTAGPAARIAGSSDVVLEGLCFGPGAGGPDRDGGLLELDSCGRLAIERCRFIDSGGSGITAYRTAAAIDHCDFAGHRGAAIFSRDGAGIIATNNAITGCGDGGILIWGSAPGHRDGSILIGNSISGIAALSGGNGQNGNGINVFQADRVIVADNQIADCAFTAVRLNATNNSQVRGNTCINSGEVAIFSEFGFSGSVISDNIVDGAATGISMTNFDSGGRLAVCSGNIVRNIRARSEVNPDTRPAGIFAEAEAAITGNVIDGVPGIGIGAGYGPFLRNVLIADNVIYGTHTGIAVTVADGAGAVKVSDNLISDPLVAGIAGMKWDEVASDDLVRDAALYPHVTVSGNTISRL